MTQKLEEQTRMERRAVLWGLQAQIQSDRERCSFGLVVNSFPRSWNAWYREDAIRKEWLELVRSREGHSDMPFTGGDITSTLLRDVWFGRGQIGVHFVVHREAQAPDRLHGVDTSTSEARTIPDGNDADQRPKHAPSTAHGGTTTNPLGTDEATAPEGGVEIFWPSQVEDVAGHERQIRDRLGTRVRMG